MACVAALRDLGRAVANREWIRLMEGYARRQGRPFDKGQAGAAMTWADPARDVAAPRACRVGEAIVLWLSRQPAR